ncbi:hypothetical protein Egran_05397 [Elaphomyces granulatus]|uniref:Uncharacterized protein n=1 Tax=Elaphomyces granulatus TaxID=519963 RepID=A0A232LRP6_9EURO|nr:hypothetical protein Egran_05397 [Elaphomyces granulatus]
MLSWLEEYNLPLTFFVLRFLAIVTASSLSGNQRSSTFQFSAVLRTLHKALRSLESPDKTLAYDTFNQYLQRLGRNAGFQDKLTPYCIRRATANAVAAVSTSSLFRQVLGHSRAEIYERYYQSQKVRKSVQAAYLETPEDECERQRRLTKQMERKYGSVPKAKGNDVRTEYVKIGANIRSLRQARQREAFSKIREEFFDKVDTLLIDQQLLGLCVEEFKIDDGEKVQFTFPERTRLAQNLFGPCKSEEDRGKIHARRVQVIANWVSLCNLRTPRN